jgi:quinol-cytochrome oxidoreductase complex cytochrome b subunit
MREFIQMICVLWIAVGAGLLAFSSKLEPQFNLADPTTLTRASLSYEDRDQRLNASIAGGVGMGFMILGTLGFLLPWFNKIGATMTRELGDTTARTIATITIWLSVAMILTFGVFGVNWTGTTALCVVLMIVAIICTAATSTSAMICGWRPWIKTSHHASEADLPKSP